MTAFLRHDLADGQVAVPDRLQAWIDLVYEYYPLVTTNITSGYASRIIWDIPVPWEALRGSFLSREGQIGAFEPPNLRDLGWDPLYIGAFKLPPNRAYAGAPIPSGYRDTVGFISAGTWGGDASFTVCDGVNDRVAVVTMESGNAGSEAETSTSFSMPSGVTPLHALTDQASATANGIQSRVFVLAKDTNNSDEAVVYASDPSGTPLEIGRATSITAHEKMLKFMSVVYFYGTTSGDSGKRTVHRINTSMTTDHEQPPPAPGPARPQFGGLLDWLFGTLFGAGGGGGNNPTLGTGEATLKLSTSTDLIQDMCLAHSTQDIIPQTEPTIFVAAEDSGGTTSTIYRERALWSGNASLTTVAVQSPLGVAGDDIECVLLHGTSLAVIGYNGTTIKWALFDLDAYSLTNADALVSGSNAAGTTILQGSGCSDGRFLYAMCADGDVARIDPAENTFEKFTPHGGFGSGGLVGSNVAFTGRSLIAHVSKSSSDGESVMFKPY